jgi:hypothetical protein
MLLSKLHGPSIILFKPFIYLFIIALKALHVWVVLYYCTLTFDWVLLMQVFECQRWIEGFTLRFCIMLGNLGHSIGNSKCSTIMQRSVVKHRPSNFYIIIYLLTFKAKIIFILINKNYILNHIVTSPNKERTVKSNKVKWTHGIFLH